MEVGPFRRSAHVCLRRLAILFALAVVSGCAIHYYDKDTGVQHIWGFGHMTMKAAKPNEGLQAVVHGADLLGLSIGKADKHSFLTAGWQRLRFIEVLKQSTSIRLEWPDSSFLKVRVGSKFPVDARDAPRGKGEPSSTAVDEEE